MPKHTGPLQPMLCVDTGGENNASACGPVRLDVYEHTASRYTQVWEVNSVACGQAGGRSVHSCTVYSGVK